MNNGTTNIRTSYASSRPFCSTSFYALLFVLYVILQPSRAFFLRPLTSKSSASSSTFLQASPSSSSFVDRSSSSSSSSSSWPSSSSSSYAARAGEDGYSILRQPLQRSNWDPNAPVEVVLEPRDLLFDEEDEYEDDASGIFVSQRDSDWWTSSRRSSHNRQQQQQQQLQQQQQSTSNENNNNAGDDGSLNLFQRSLETLDYPRVLQALVMECTTAPAKRILQQAMRASNSEQPSSSSITTTSSWAFQPLAADSVQGARERYRAVQELEWILTTQVVASSMTFKDSRGFKQSLWTPPPIRSGCNLEPLFSPSSFSSALEETTITETMMSSTSTTNNQGGGRRSRRRRPMDADDVFQVLDLLETMQTVQNWGRALREYNNNNNNNAQDEGDYSETKKFVELPKFAVDCITVNETLQDLLSSAFDITPTNSNNNKRSTGVQQQQRLQLSGTTFPELGRLRARVQALRGDILSTLDTLVALPSMQAKLSTESTSSPSPSSASLYSEISGRLVLPILKSKYSSSVGIVHDTSRSGKTVYVEPSEIVSRTNELRQAEGELRTQEAKVWRLLSQEIYANQRDLETSAAALGQLDLVHSKYRLGREKLQGVIPNVQDEGVISLQNAKHPVLLLREGLQVVGSTIELGTDGVNQGLVLTGPNAGGKTVILKLLGLLAHMARAGIPVPADPNPQEAPRVDFFHPILADIGDLQSVGGDLSTFSGHMLVCREVLRNAGRNALVLMDEVGSGTDPNQGVALAQALLEELLETGARVAITTHFLQLKQLAASDKRFAVAGMQFVNGRPTYKLLPGHVGESFALSVAERLELPQKVINRATELLDSETRQMGDLIRDLENQKALVDMQVAELEEKQREMARMEQQLREEMIRLEKTQLVARREEAKKFARKLEEKEQVLESILEKLKSDPSRRIVAKSWDDIKFVKRDALNEAENIPSVIAQKLKVEAAMEQVQAALVPVAELRDRPDLGPGDKVIICKTGPLLGREATVTKYLGGRVEVKVNNVNVGLKLTEVAMPTSGDVLGVNGETGNGSRGSFTRSVSKAAEQALRVEQSERRWSNDRSDAAGSSSSTSVRPSGTFALRTQSNTVDVRGCNLDGAKTKVTEAFSRGLMNGRPVVYILHGHGTGGVLKTKIRNWLQSERALVKNFQSADMADGGDAFTRVELR